jgi:hypothetical protein
MVLARFSHGKIASWNLIFQVANEDSGKTLPLNYTFINPLNDSKNENGESIGFIGRLFHGRGC